MPPVVYQSSNPTELPPALPALQSDRSVLSRPSMDLVVWLLDSSISSAAALQAADRLIGPRLAAALAACAQLSALPASQRMWSLQSLRNSVGSILNLH